MTDLLRIILTLISIGLGALNADSANSVTNSPRPQKTSSPATTAKPIHGIIRSGEASWGPFKGHVVTRYPRGTAIRVCGRLGCTGITRSWGYGPAKYTGRIADLDVRVFEHVCGPRSIGVCKIKLFVYR